MNLAALRGSRTSLIRCAGVELEGELLIAGPSERVLGASGGGGLETSCLALGLAGAAIDFLRRESIVRRELTSIVERFTAVQTRARNRLHELATSASDPDGTMALHIESHAPGTASDAG